MPLRLASYPDEVLARPAAGRHLERRAIQLGLRGAALRRYGREAIVAIEDVSPLVAEGRAAARRGDLSALRVPVERADPVVAAAAAARLGLQPGGAVG